MKYRKPLRAHGVEFVNALECHMPWPHNLIHAIWRLLNADTPPPTDDETIEKVIEILRRRTNTMRYALIEDIYKHGLSVREIAEKHHRSIERIRQLLRCVLRLFLCSPMCRVCRGEKTPANILDALDREQVNAAQYKKYKTTYSHRRTKYERQSVHNPNGSLYSGRDPQQVANSLAVIEELLQHAVGLVCCDSVGKGPTDTECPQTGGDTTGVRQTSDGVPEPHRAHPDGSGSQ